MASWSAAQDLGALKQRFAARYAQLKQIEREEKAGETPQGFVEAVTPAHLADATVKKIIDEENADRRALYAALAKKENTTEAKVAERNAARNFQNAGSGEYLKQPNGTWRQK
jgi:uncharacterized protein YdbL (DUF1318 family)